ncbi:MAG: hypothetical protein ACYCS7_04950 [Acidimicrobiales bacterium]
MTTRAVEPVTAEALTAPPIVTRPAHLDVFPGFAREVLPALVAWWGLMLGLFYGLDRDYYLAIALVGTPTLVMLWPVGRHLGRSYLSYRPLPWILGILTMWMIPATGLVITQTNWSFDTKSTVFFSLPAVIAFGGILVALPWAQSRPPLRMFFRPDLLFGDGRTLVGGTLLLVLGMRYLLAGHPPGELWALPAWNWLSLSFAIAAGIIPIVLIRGMVKLVQRYLRLRDGLFSGYPSLAMREWMLLLFGASFGYAFHHVFMGKTVFTTIGQPGLYPITLRFWVGIGIMGAAAWWLLAAKGGFKRLIGEPFFFETFGQSLQKQLVFVVGWAAFFYGFISMLASTTFGTLQPWDAQSAAGLGLFLTGIVVLTLGRAVAQHYQRQGMLAHFVAVLAPAQVEGARERLTSRILEGMATLPPHRQVAAWRVIHRAWAGIDPDERSLMIYTVVHALASVGADEAEALTASERQALDELDEPTRTAAVSELRRAIAAVTGEPGEPGEPSVRSPAAS